VQAIVCVCDLTVDRDMVHVQKTVIESFGRLDVLINCAGKFELLFIVGRKHLRWRLLINVPVGLRLLDGC
jgi:NAD(P)-dependent dehydrogenase (short-subunit alcohol dehydrogenase family)